MCIKEYMKRGSGVQRKQCLYLQGMLGARQTYGVILRVD